MLRFSFRAPLRPVLGVSRPRLFSYVTPVVSTPKFQAAKSGKLGKIIMGMMLYVDVIV